jgi:hypothetical protein
MSNLKLIPGFEKYACCDQGHIYSLEKRAGHYSVARIRKLKATLNKSGYLSIGLRKDGKGHGFTVHKLVALTWIYEKPEGMEINHKDGNKLNNIPENLEYITHLENIRHAWKNGLRNNFSKKISEKVSGEKHYNAKIDDKTFCKLLEDHKNGMKNGALAIKYGIHQTTVSYYTSGKRRKPVITEI